MTTQAEKSKDSDDKVTEIYVGSLVIHLDRSPPRHETRLERMLKKSVPRTIIWEPCCWLYPAKICYLYLAHRSTRNSSGGRFTLEQQVEAAQREFPARTQWTAYCSDVDRLAHVPKNVLDMIKPKYVRRQNPILSSAGAALL
ncbi:hypothetical protein PHMEG_00012723 [Phytophthora megakarya]|uniref:Uncharacterized protein n=1 Tax=Phytophthora megakarya TaxID=4795 RepID=A0A225WA42_9STRA|nr:hypothetical protein PHMEG_00012723 [Phytophthora megakarya]